MLTLTFLGVGSAFAKRNHHSNALVEAWSSGPQRQTAPDDTLLIDFGTTGPIALRELAREPGFAYLEKNGRVNYPAINRVLVTHTHADHVGGLEELVGMNVFGFGDFARRRWSRPELIGSGEVLARLWSQGLGRALGALVGRTASPQDFFSLRMLSPPDGVGLDRFTLLDRYAFSIFPTDHIRLLRKYDWPSVGVLMRDQDSGATAVFSGDTRFDPDHLGSMMAAAVLNFHEVQLEDDATTVHTLLSQLRGLPEATRAKTYLYHYWDDWDSDRYASVTCEFAGFAKPRHRYVLFD